MTQQKRIRRNLASKLSKRKKAAAKKGMSLKDYCVLQFGWPQYTQFMSELQQHDIAVEKGTASKRPSQPKAFTSPDQITEQDIKQAFGEMPRLSWCGGAYVEEFHAKSNELIVWVACTGKRQSMLSVHQCLSEVTPPKSIKGLVMDNEQTYIASPFGDAFKMKKGYKKVLQDMRPVEDYHDYENENTISYGLVYRKP